jgi:fructose/tagatose bisphosphate aldolase
LLLNESPYPAWIQRAVDLGFNLVMFSDEHLGFDQLREAIKKTVAYAKGKAAVEAEMAALPGMASDLKEPPYTPSLTDPDAAAAFVQDTGVQALAVSLGNVHLHGRFKVGLDLDRLRAIRQRVSIPLSLHGATSIADDALRQAIQAGIRKINVGSAVRAVFYRAVREAVLTAKTDFNPYDVLGSGSSNDILIQGRLAVRDLVREKMELFGSAGRAAR